MENFYYAAIYDVLRESNQHATKLLALKKLKAKIIRLNSTHRQRILVDTAEQDRTAGEDPSLYHLIKTQKRQASRLINYIIDDDGNLQTSSASILKAFSAHFRKKFQPTRINKRSLEQLTKCRLQIVTPEMNAALVEPITLQELWLAISKGTSNKAPGPDEVCLQIYKTAWDVIKLDFFHIINCMYLNGTIMANQLHGHIIYLPKKDHPNRTDDYRPLTLMNTDYMIMTRIIANRLKPEFRT